MSKDFALINRGTSATPGEVSYGAEIVRPQYPPGNLKRYTANDGDGSTDVSGAFTAMLNSGEVLCTIPTPTSSWVIDNTVTWVSGVSVISGRKTAITSTVASGEWTFLFDGVPYGEGAAFEGFVLTVAANNAKGIQIWESRNVRIMDFDIIGPSGIGGHGIEINGGDDASGTYGAAHNWIANGRIYKMATGLRFYTDNTTTPADTTAFANRNFVFGVHCNSCTEGLYMDRANTNEIFGLSLQANTEGADIGQFARKNTLHLIPENNTRAIVIHTSSTDNVFLATVQTTDFVDSGGSAVVPHLSTKILGSQSFQWPRDITIPSGGSIRWQNPFGASTMRMRMGDTYDINWALASHDASDNAVDLAILTYHATVPYINFPQGLTVAGGPTLSAGSGTPEAAVTAPVGSIFMRTNGGAATSIYVKESGTGNTGWVAK